MTNPLQISAMNTDIGTATTQRNIGSTATAKSSQSEFAEMLTQAGTNMVQTLENAEAASIAGMKSEVGAYEVVSSIMEAEQTLRMTVAVRDKIISAYLEISRMQI